MFNFYVLFGLFISCAIVVNAQEKVILPDQDKIDFQILLDPNINIDKNQIITEVNSYVSTDGIKILTRR